MRPSRTAAFGLAAALLLTPTPANAEPESGAAGPSRSAPATDRPGLVDPAPCEGEPEFVCGTLRVPLDHTGEIAGTLDLAVAVDRDSDAPRGILLLLTGGPGQPGVGLLSRVKGYFEPEVLAEYRLVVFDQRGTGRGAIDCSTLQAETGGSDFLNPSEAAVAECAETIGAARNFSSTPDTVGDIELLRRALGARRLTLDGISYGTFTAEQYALAHPERVRALVLDSVVPQDGYDPLLADSMRATGRVLRDACADDPECTTDPAADLAWLVRHGRIDGAPIDATRFLESLGILSIDPFNPSFAGIPALLHAARSGETTELEAFLDAASSLGTPADQLSAGLHLATTCADRDFPWGDASTPRWIRRLLLEATLATMPAEAFWPYTKSTARAALPIAGCLTWPAARPAPDPERDVIPHRSLILAGEHDLFTLASWAEDQADRMPRAHLVRFPGRGHGLQSNPAGRAAVRDFLLR
jgi:pimeloyl-ACP methyl ester carboxylesterase